MVAGSLCCSPLGSCSLPQGSGDEEEGSGMPPTSPPTCSHNQQAEPFFPTDRKSSPSLACCKPLTQESIVMLSPGSGSEEGALLD